MRRALAAALVLALLLPGCSLLRREGSETLRIQNQDQPLTAVIVITQRTGEFRVFGESLFFDRGAVRELELAMRPGAHTVAVTTSTSVEEFLPITIPDSGDTSIDIVFWRGGATITTSYTR